MDEEENRLLDRGSPEEVLENSVQFVVTKFLKKGFHGLTVEELAVASISPDFNEKFKKQTGIDWVSKYQAKALERLSRAKFDLHWMTKKTKNVYDFLFQNCVKGDTEKVREFISKSDSRLILEAVDERKQSPLHLCSQRGHITLVEYLILKGFNPNARDRTLKSPLHLAAQYGHEVIADALLKQGALIEVKDSCGRNPFHYACCSNSPQLISLFIGLKPEIVHIPDNIGRSPLHYAVWNSTLKTVDIIRGLLDRGADINAKDDDGKTPLHHAAEGGKTRAIPILLQRGADIGIREKLGNRTALDLAANDRTRELIIVYSSSPYNMSREDVNYMNLAIKGVSAKTKKTLPQGSTRPTAIPSNTGPPGSTLNQRIFPGNESLYPVPNFLREAFFDLLKAVQESGVSGYQHYKRPYLYTGSWLEGCRTVEELFQRIESIKPAEAVIRTFNVLCPYDKGLPQVNREEAAVSNFYGDPWYEWNIALNDKNNNMVNEKINGLQEALDAANRKAFEFEEKFKMNASEVDRLRAELEKFKLNEQQNKQSAISSKEIEKSKQEIEKLKALVAELETFNEEYKTDLEDKERQIEDLQGQLDEMANGISKVTDMDLKKARDDGYAQGKKEGEVLANKQMNKIQQELELLRKQKADLETENFNIKDERNLIKGDEKKARYKAGKLFLQAIQEAKKVKLRVDDPRLNTKEGVENLQDDEAIIRMFQALKNNPPPLMDRLRQADKNADNKLDQNEFTSFGEKLKLAPQDIQSLCRVAGFFSGKMLVGIDEFKMILEERPRMRQDFEKGLFKRILRAIHAKNLTVETMFDLIDVDNSRSITPAELKTGFESLRIVLNQRDFNNIFNIFDKNKDNTLSLEEMRGTFEYYEKLPGDGEDDLMEMEDRTDVKNVKGLDDFEEGMKTMGSGRLIGPKDLAEQDLKINEDIDLFTGDIKIQVPYGKEIVGESKLKEITIRTRLKGSNEPELSKSIVLIDKSRWNYAVKIPVRNSLKENLADFVNIQLYSANVFNEETYLGEINVEWKACIENPEAWHVNHEFNVSNIAFIGRENAKKVTGILGVQIKWIPSTSKNFKSKIAEDDIPYSRRKLVSPLNESGMLQVTIVSAIIWDKKAEIQCTTKIPQKSAETEKAKFDHKKNPLWGSKYNQELTLTANKEVDCLSVNVFFETGGFIGIGEKKNVLGDFFIDWTEAILYPGEYMTHKAFMMFSKGSPTIKLYIKTRWIPKALYNKFIAYDQMNEKDKKKKITQSEEDFQKGRLKFMIIRGKNLPGKEIDPYALVKYDAEVFFEVQTKAKKKTFNPEWIELFEKDIKFLKEGLKPPLFIDIKDSNVLKDALIGRSVVDLTSCFENPGKWAIDNFYPVEMPNSQASEAKKEPESTVILTQESPQIYVTAYFVPAGTVDPNVKPVDKEGKVSLAADDIISGTFKIKIVHARDIKPADGKTSDPYCVVQFPDKKEEKTSTISKTVNPIWNEMITKQIKIAKDKYGPLKFIIKDSDFLAKDDLLGYVDVQWEKCIKNPGTWQINEVLKISGSVDEIGNLSSLGYLYVQIKFLEDGMVDDGKEAEIIENLAEIISKKQGVYTGVIRVFLVQAKELLPLDNNGKSDPKVVFKVPGGKKVESKVISENLNPVWKTIYSIPINMPRDMMQPMRVEVLDNDLVGDDFIGYVDVALDKCFETPGKWEVNKEFELIGDTKLKKEKKIKSFGFIYMQVMYVPEGTINNENPLPLLEDLDEVQRKKKLEDEIPIKGKLKTVVVMARGLVRADISKGGLSDPYVKIEYPDKKNITSKAIKSTVNPVWNFEHPTMIDITRGKYKPIKVTVLDEDKMASDDTLGFVDAEWKTCYENPGLWMVNKLFQLEGAKSQGKDLGEIYLQMRFLNEGEEDNNKACSTIPDLMLDYGRVVGVINVEVISGGNLKSTDLIGKVDAFCLVYLSNNPEVKLKTITIENNPNPVWKFSGQLFVDVRKIEAKTMKMVVDVMDDDAVGSDKVGQINIDLLEFFVQPGVSKGLDYEVIASNKSKEKRGTIKLLLQWVADERTESIEDLKAAIKTVTGNLFINIIDGKRCSKKGFFGNIPGVYCETHLTDNYDKKTYIKTKPVKSIDPVWNHTTLLKFENLPEKDFQFKKLEFNLYRDDTLSGDDILGGVTIELEDLLKNPGKWRSEYLELMKDEKPTEFSSWVGLQLQWRPEGAPVEALEARPPDWSAIEAKLKPKTVAGDLVLNIIGAKHLRNADMTGNSDPFCTVTLNKGEKTSIKTKTLDDNQNPVWGHKGSLKINLQEDEFGDLQVLVKVFDYDYDGDDLLGKVDIPFTFFLSNPGKWYNEITAMFDDKGFPNNSQVYLQAQWRPLTIPPTAFDEREPEDKFLAEKRQQEEALKKKQEEEAKIKKIEGDFFVHIYEAKNLPSADIGGLSDPFVLVSLNKGEKKQIKTKVIDDNQNPKWEHKESIAVAVPDNEFSDFKLLVKVMDYDFGGQDLLGSIAIEVDDIMKNPGKWINQYYGIIQGVGKECGKVYVQAQFRPKGAEIDLKEPAIVEKTQEPEPTFPGVLYVKCIGAKNVKNSDTFGASDCFCEIQVSKKTNCTKIITTKTIDNSLNPRWDHEDGFQLNLPKKDYTELKLFCKVFDYDYMKNNFLGRLIIDLDPLFLSPGEWHNKPLLLMEESGKGATSGELYVQIQWRPEGFQSDGGAPPNLYGEGVPVKGSQGKLEDKPFKPEAKPDKPEAKPDKPEAKPDKPEAKPDKPVEKPSKPEEKPSKPQEKPETKPTKPEDKNEAGKDSENAQQRRGGKKADEKIPEKPGDKADAGGVQKPVEAPLKEGCLKFSIISGSGFAKSWKDTPDPFCVVYLIGPKPLTGGAARKIKTPAISDNVAPIWNATDHIKLSMKEEELMALNIEAVVEDEEIIGSTLIGKTQIDGKSIFNNPRKWISGEYNLLDKGGKNVTGKLKLELIWEPKE